MNRLLSFNISLALIFGSMLAAFSTAVPLAFAADTVSSAKYIDADKDGTVDHLKWTFDTNITACAYEAGDWTVNTAGTINVSAITGINTADPEGNGDGVCDGTDAIVYIAVTTTAQVTGGGTNPVVSYTDQGTTGSLADSGSISSKASVAQTDGAGAVIRGMTYLDGDRDGKIDQFRFTFSESITGNSVLANNNLDVTTDGDFDGADFGSSSTDRISFAGNTKSFSLTGEATTIDTYDDSGSLAISLTGTFILDDGNGNLNTEADILGDINPSFVIDDAEPALKQVDYKDADADGLIDSATITFSEILDDTSVVSANDLAFSNVGDFTGLAFGTDATDLVTTDTNTFNVTFGTEANAVDTSEDSGNIAIIAQNSYSVNGANSALDSTTESGFDSSIIVYTDASAPVIASVSPGDGLFGDATSNIVITFSESMNTTFVEAGEFTVSPDPGAFTTTWSVNDSVVTLDSDTDFDCDQLYTVATAEANIDAASGTPTALATTGPEDGDWTFTAICSTGGTSVTTPLPTYEALLLSPNGGESLMVGDTTEVTWSTGGTGTLSYVDLLLSVDGGNNYTTIVENTVNDGTYSWTVAGDVTTNARMKVEAHNNLAALAQDDSDISFSITELITNPVTETLGEVSEPASGTMGLSPVTGLMEEISVVHAGDLVRSTYFDTVYYVDNNLVRHPFFNETIYATWYDDFSTVKVVTDATLPTLPLGTNMLPKPGVTWVKIQSLDKVYLVEANPLDEFKPVLRWVSSEALSETLLGTDWADYVIDIDVSLFGRFDFGADILNTSDAVIDMNVMKKRVELSI